jgi:hypothetical protein
MVRRLAEVQGGWAKVEGRDGGGSAFQVFLPAGGGVAPASSEGSDDATPEPEPVTDEVEHDPNHWVKAEQALVRELRQLSQGKAK